ncbi:AI-2E family transporter [Fundicoccus culcitae]|uniref:AI-2E family transporter n=1 Tax=Fundicoccus culcitae TaxID=2969821 RepID=A0ABY5P7S6_9LACT|nr:AI-2E family transporter [Fundicoccus culcitae]UUX34651.1 AI-2E family transporter [Fundicoccus culcitae]
MTDKDKKIVSYIILVAVLFLAVLNWDIVVGAVRVAWSVASPLVVGGVLAYIINILMMRIEKIWFPKTTNSTLIKMRRPMSIFLAIITILTVILIILGLIIPQLISVVLGLIESIPILVVFIEDLANEYSEYFPQLSAIVDGLDIDWSNMVRNIVNVLNNLSSSLVGSTLSTVGSMFSFIVNGFLSLMIAIYILSSKEKLGAQFKRLIRIYFSENVYNKIFYVLSVTDESFDHFITGEVIEAFILGSMVAVGMWILRMPYALMIGVLTGVTALIPLIGAYLSGAIGFILIFVQSPMQALGFLVFIIVIQQIEGNIIYPKVVGNSLGLPGLWVLVAVTIGGGLLGIPGMLIGVPLGATVYKLVKFDMRRREEKEAKAKLNVLENHK